MAPISGGPSINPAKELRFKQIAVAAAEAPFLYGLTEEGRVYRYNGGTEWMPLPMKEQL